MSVKSAGDVPAAYLTTSLLNEHRQAAQSTQSDFVDNTAKISGNLNGGAGYFAETHHAASFNVNQADAGLEDRATLINSNPFGSVDILTDSGVAANPKFYATASESYAAGAQLVEHDSDITAKYAGQDIIVPQDQLSEVLRQFPHARGGVSRAAS